MYLFRLIIICFWVLIGNGSFRCFIVCLIVKCKVVFLMVIDWLNSLYEKFVWLEILVLLCGFLKWIVFINLFVNSD